MKIKLILVYLIALFGLAACYVPESAYYPDYDRDYVYSVGYHGYRPYDWGDGFYSTYGWGTKDWVEQPRFYSRQSGYVLGPGCDVRH